MRTFLLLTALLAAVALAPQAAASDPWPACAAPDYCVDVDDGQVCTTVNLGDMEGPYTRCEDVPAAAVGALPGQCTGYGDHSCYDVDGTRVCVTYDLGDLEGPYTTCFGK